jgi:hypothetical protein
VHSAPRQLARDHPATRARADDACVCLEHDIVAVDHERTNRLGHRRRRTQRTGIAERRPVGVAPRCVGQRITQAQRDLLQRHDAHSGLGRARGDGVDQRFACRLIRRQEACRHERVEQGDQPAARRFGHHDVE